MTSLNQWWPSLLSQYDATWLQWVNDACEWRPWFLCHFVWQSIGPFFYVINLWKYLAYIYPNFLGFSLHCYFWNSFSYSYHLHIFKGVSISILPSSFGAVAWPSKESSNYNGWICYLFYNTPWYNEKLGFSVMYDKQFVVESVLIKCNILKFLLT